MQKMKRFMMILAAALLMVGAGYAPAKATTITQGVFLVPPVTGNTFVFQVAANSSTTISLSSIGFMQGLSFDVCTNGACGSGGTSVFGPGHSVVPLPGQTATLGGFLTLAQATSPSFANLIATTNYYLTVSAPFFGLVFGLIQTTTTAAPIPASLLMFLTALVGLGFMVKRRKSLLGAVA